MLIFKMENAKLPQRFWQSGPFWNIPSKPWSKRNTASNMRSLPILGMLLHLASLLFRLVPFLQCSLSSSFQLPIAFRWRSSLLDYPWSSLAIPVQNWEKHQPSQPCFATWSLAFSPWVWLTSSDNSLVSKKAETFVSASDWRKSPFWTIFFSLF